MSRRTETGVPTPFSLPAVTLAADHVLGLPPCAAPSSTLEPDMHHVPEQLARHPMEHRHREAEAWRVRRVALAVRRAESAERRARLAREAAVLASRQATIATA